MSLESLSSLAVRLGEKRGASQIEAYVLETDIKSVYVEEQVPKIVEDKKEAGLGVRVAVGKKLGFFSTTNLSEEGVDETVDRAISIAKASKEDPFFKSFPEPRKTPSIPGLEDPSISSMETAQMVDFTSEIVDSATQYSEFVDVPLGLARATRYWFHVENSVGMDVQDSGTHLFVHFTAKADKSEKTFEGIEKVYSRGISGVDPSEIGRIIATRAVEGLEAKAWSGSETVTAVICPVEFAGMLLGTVAYAVSSENVHKKRSPWTEKLGEKVCDEKVTILDDGTDVRGVKTSTVDDEGAPMKKKSVIDHGVLKGFIYDSYNAKMDDVESTGNAFRRSARTWEKAFASIPTCAVSNLIMKTGSRNVEGIIAEIQKGVYVEKFAIPTADPLTGNFGLEIRNAKLIEKGELTKPIKYAMLSGNLYELLKRVVDVSKESKVVGSAILPHVALAGAELIGKNL